MSPHDIMVLLHHYSSPADWPLGNTSAYKSTIAWMFSTGLAYRQDSVLLTNKGLALVKMLCATPLPEQRFINPLTGKAIDGEGGL